ncbi:MAG: efflux RND transporter periplasmic adaptor subunit [Prevotella sp.]|nr:efflux RND transporter periplasmic adaptor subunit [Prevotella sp.]
MVLALMAAVLATSCSQKQQTARETVVNVKTVRVEAGSHVVGKSYMGKIVEEDGANVSFGVIGNVVRVMVEEGQFVKKGQAMAEVDGQNVRSAHEISAATLNQAEDAYRRLKNLYDKGTLPEIKMVEMETALAKARAAEAISRKSVGEIVLRAPFNGFVASSTVHVGASVVPGVTGFRLVKIDRVKVDFDVPEKEIGRVEVGQTVTFTVSALGDSVFTGRVVNRAVAASAVSHSYGVKALVANGCRRLLPGMVCKVRLQQADGGYVIVVPQQSVQIDGRDRYVWTVKDGAAHRQSVTTGDILNEGVVVESGLTTGDLVITEGQNKVCEGMKVRES